MLSDKKRSSHRLSSLFSISSSSDHHESGSVASSESSGRLSKVKNRISSATHLTPDYPPPQPPNYSDQRQLTIQPVESVPATLEPPPRIPAPRSRSESPARPPTAARSRPGTANPDAAGGAALNVPNDSKLKKLKRKSGLFGNTPRSSDEGVSDSSHGPLAWVVGHQGKVSYNLTMLLNGEKVC